MSRILLVNPPMLTEEGEYIDGYQGARPRLPALGLAYIAGVLQKKGHEVKIIDGMAEVIPLEQIGRIAASFDIVGITSVTFLSLLAHAVAKAVKEQSAGIPVVMGGPHATVLPEDVLKDGNVDYVVIGEGENTFLELVDALNRKGVSEDVLGIAYRNGQDVVFSGPRPVEDDLDKFPLPARNLLPMGLYRSSEVRSMRHPALHMMSSRGCPYNCSFCSNKVIHRHRLRLHSPERVVEEMKVLVNDFGAREIHFWDDCFVFDEERVYQICERLHKENLHIPWDCEATIDRVNPALLKEMKKAGCFSVSYGIETSSNERLRKLNKGWLNQDRIKQAVEWTRNAKLKVRGYFMFGFVGEALAEMEQTISFAKGLALDFATFSLLVPLPGTEDYERAKQEGEFDPSYWKKRLVSEISFPLDPVYIPAGVTKEQLINIHRKACREFYFRPGMILKRLFDLRSFSNLSGSLKTGILLLQKSNKP